MLWVRHCYDMIFLLLTCVSVALHRLEYQTNKTQRLLSDVLSFFPEAEHSLQVTSCKETSSIGSLLRTLRRTMTLFGKHTMKEPQPGFWRATY
jgi:hypothetical protein